MIKAGIEHLRKIQQSCCAVDVEYKPLDGAARTIKATIGRTVFKAQDASGIWTRFESKDFIVNKDQLPSPPQVGDEITHLGRTYEVLAPNGEPAVRESDPQNSAYRIHTKEIGGDDG